MDITTHPVAPPLVRWRVIGVAALVALVIASAVAVYVGTRPRIPDPFGLAGNGQIAVSVDGDIHLVDPVTGVSAPIVTGPETDIRVAVSPTGAEVVFERGRDIDGVASYELVVAGIDGSDERVISPAGRNADGFESFAWSPDGHSVLVDIAQSPGVWLLDADGDAEPRQVVDRGHAYEYPFRPPDGAAILIQREDATGRQMLAVDLQTGRETVLAKGGGIVGDDLNDARWSPDGSNVVYHTAPMQDRASQRLFVVDAEGTDTRQITNAPGVWWDIDPTWSPTGKHLAFGRYEEVDGSWLVRRIAIYEMATGTIREVGPLAIEARAAQPNPADPQNPGEGMWLEWSPDGTALIAVPTEGTAHPVLIDVASGGWRNLEPLVSPDFVTQSWQRRAS